MVLETFFDHFLWIWHAAFGYTGTLNNINIWERSPLLRSFLDGTFSEYVDFEFNIGGKTSGKLWLLVDSIYPDTAWFVSTIDNPIGVEKILFAQWQELSWKDIICTMAGIELERY
jgi:Plant transposon protein